MNYEEALYLGMEEVEVLFEITGRGIYASVDLSSNDDALRFVSLNTVQLLSPTRRSFYSFREFDDGTLKVCKVYGKSCRSSIYGFLIFILDYVLMVLDRFKLKYFT
jgi:hypothetical protein